MTFLGDDLPHCPHHPSRLTIKPGLYGCGFCTWQREGPIEEEVVD